MNSVKVNISDLNQDMANVREHNKKNLDTIKASLQKFGQYKPLIVQQSTNIVLVGNARLSQMKELGLEYVECVFVNIPNDRAELLKIADNRTADLSNWDYEKLLKQIEVLPADFTSVAFDQSDYEYLRKISKQKVTLKPKLISCPFCNHEFTSEKE